MDDGQLERQLADIFFIESGEMLSEAALALLRAEGAGNPQDVVHQVFRAIHSIKGGAQSLGFEQLAEVTHRVEDFLVPLQQGSPIDRQTVSLMLEIMDVIEMQLRADQAGEPPVDCALLLGRLAEIARLLMLGLFPGEILQIAKKYEYRSAKGSRILYLSFTVDPTAPMPGMTAFLLLEQLRQSGRLLYSNPGIENIDMAVAGEYQYLTQTAIIQTDMCNADVKQEAYRVSDVRDIKVAEINNGIFSNADKPAKREITCFNSLVGKMREMLCCENRDTAYLNNIAGEIVHWGEESRGAAGWFPGGLPAWQRMTLLLSNTVVLTENTLSHHETKSLATRTLQVLWEAVYNALCNHTYFYSLPVRDILDGNGLSIIEQFVASGVDVHVVNIDVSTLMTLEGEHLRMLADFRDKLAQHGWVLWLISEGNYTRRHLNVLEASEELVGVLELYPSLYSGVLALKKMG